MGLLLLAVFVLIVWPTTTHAESNYCEQIGKGNNIFELFGAQASYDGDTDKITLMLNSASYSQALQEIKSSIKFKIYSIEVYDTTNRNGKNPKDKGILLNTYYAEKDSYVIKEEFGIDVNDKNAYLTTKHNIVMGTYKKSNNPMSYHIRLYAADNWYAKICKDWIETTTSPFFVEYIVDIGGRVVKEEVVLPVEADKPVTGNKIECSNYQSKYPKEGFEYKYCELKTITDDLVKKGQAIEIPYTADADTYEKYAAKNGLSSIVAYTCNAFDVVPNIVTDDSTYYKNAKYLHGTVINEVKGKYEYKYGCKTVPEEVSCKVKCDEYVSVEYGPPIAMTAGLCLEYKVKVTSRVNCEVAELPKKPNNTATKCTPIPACEHGSGGWIGTAAGPSEDYDACVEACDGGQYTTDCSVKCYDEVYNTTNNSASKQNLTPTLALYTERVAFYDYNTMTRDKNCDYKGQYTCSGNNIVWNATNSCRPSNNDNKSGLASFYKGQSSYDHYVCIKTDVEGGGIASVCGCTATCKWTGCNDENQHQYINEDQIKIDYDSNMAIYNKLVDDCSKYSKCSTTQSTYTISADYSYEGKKTTVYYPHTDDNSSNEKAKIKYSQQFVTCSPTDESKNIFLSTNGCYNCKRQTAEETTSSSSTWYQAEWSFPGVWVNMKNGNISYNYESGNWKQIKNKFCLPESIDDVNEKWFNYYYMSEKNALGPTYSFNDTSETEPGYHVSLEESCKTELTQNDIDKLVYNINASTRKFGLFEWNIDISCFYASNKDFPSIPGECACVDCAKDEGYVIRTVDLANLFPNEDGERTNIDKNNPSNTGRSPGYNWSAYAINNKDSEYRSDPFAYRGWVQSMNTSIYSDEYLDYEVTLTKDTINKMKKQNKNTTDFNKSTLDPYVDSVINYRSELLRGENSVIPAKDKKIPKDEALKCNNLVNWKSTECFEGGNS